MFFQTTKKSLSKKAKLIAKLFGDKQDLTIVRPSLVDWVLFSLFGLHYGLYSLCLIPASFNIYMRIISTLFIASIGYRVTYLCNTSSKMAHLPNDIKLLDSSVIINTGFADYICRGFMSGLLCIPNFVLQELHIMADSSDASTREKGKIGLFNATKILKHKQNKLIALQKMVRGDKVDELLIVHAVELESLIGVICTIVTADSNLEKMAMCRNIHVHNMNTMMFLLKKSIYINDIIIVSIVKKGERRSQGIGYAEDGTMLVVEDAETYIGRRVKAEVKTIRSIESGRIAFCSLLSVEDAVRNTTNLSNHSTTSSVIVNETLNGNVNGRYETYSRKTNRK